PRAWTSRPHPSTALPPLVSARAHYGRERPARAEASKSRAGGPAPGLDVAVPRGAEAGTRPRAGGLLRATSKRRPSSSTNVTRRRPRDRRITPHERTEQDRDGDRDAGRRLLLVPRSRFPRSAWRAGRAIRLRRRPRAQPDVRAGLHRHDRPRGGRAGRVRPGRALLPRPAARLFLDPRPHDAEPPGPRRRHAVPLSDLLSFRGAEADRGGSDRGAGGREGRGHADRDRGRAAGRVLPRRGVPPRVLPAAPGAGVLPRGDRAEAGEVQEGVRGAAEGVSGAFARAPLFACQWRSKMSHLWRLKMSHSAGGDEPLVRR